MSHQTLLDAISKAGSQSAFARAVGTSQQRVSYLIQNRKPLPAELVLAAETAFGIPRGQWRPDLYPPESNAA